MSPNYRKKNEKMQWFLDKVLNTTGGLWRPNIDNGLLRLFRSHAF